MSTSSPESSHDESSSSSNSTVGNELIENNRSSMMDVIANLKSKETKRKQSSKNLIKSNIKVHVDLMTLSSNDEIELYSDENEDNDLLRNKEMRNNNKEIKDYASLPKRYDSNMSSSDDDLNDKKDCDDWLRNNQSKNKSEEIRACASSSKRNDSYMSSSDDELQDKNWSRDWLRNRQMKYNNKEITPYASSFKRHDWHSITSDNEDNHDSKLLKQDDALSSSGMAESRDNLNYLTSAPPNIRSSKRKKKENDEGGKNDPSEFKISIMRNETQNNTSITGRQKRTFVHSHENDNSLLTYRTITNLVSPTSSLTNESISTSEFNIIDLYCQEHNLNKGNTPGNISKTGNTASNISRKKKFKYEQRLDCHKIRLLQWVRND